MEQDQQKVVLRKPDNLGISRMGTLSARPGQAELGLELPGTGDAAGLFRPGPGLGDVMVLLAQLRQI